MKESGGEDGDRRAERLPARRGEAGDVRGCSTDILASAEAVQRGPKP